MMLNLALTDLLDAYEKMCQRLGFKPAKLE